MDNQKPATLPEENSRQWKKGEVKVSVTSSKSEMKPREITVIEKQNLLGETEKTDKQNSLRETGRKNLDERNTNFKAKAGDKQNLIKESQMTERQNFASERSMKGVRQNDISECQGQVTCDNTNKTKTKNVIKPLRDSILKTKDNMIKENANAKVLITPVFTDNSSDDNIAQKDNFPETEKPKYNSSNTNDCIIDIPDSNVKLELSNVEENPMNNIQDEKLKPCLDTLSFTEPCCRVCQCNGDEEILINPCNCSGSVKWVHESCLVQWMKSSFKDSCELCLRKIQIAKRVKPLSKWKLPSRRPTPVVWVLVFVTAIALNLASIVKDASRLCSTTPCLVFYAVGCMGIILGSLFLIFWTKRARNFFNHWLEQNEEWVIISKENEKNKELYKHNSEHV